MSTEFDNMDNLVSERLIQARKLLKLNQGDVAKLVGLKGPAAISKWEKGQRKLSLENVSKLAEVYGVSKEYLVTGRIDINTSEHIRDALRCRVGIKVEDISKKLGKTVQFMQAVINEDVSPSNSVYKELMEVLGEIPNDDYYENKINEIQNKIIPHPSIFKKICTQCDEKDLRIIHLQYELNRLQERDGSEVKQLQEKVVNLEKKVARLQVDK